MSMSSAGRAENSNGCVTRPKGREIGLSGFAAQIQLYSLTGSYVMATAEHREPYESRGSRTVLGARGGEIPPRDSTFTSLWLLRSTVRMSASHPKATESLRSSEMTLSAKRRPEQVQQSVYHSIPSFLLPSSVMKSRLLIQSTRRQAIKMMRG